LSGTVAEATAFRLGLATISRVAVASAISICFHWWPQPTGHRLVWPPFYCAVAEATAFRLNQGFVSSITAIQHTPKV
ncbi:MAG TPA: hypothetical protein PLQ80_06795, partial [Candidatus Syntrophosphaera sp.]|nr:hypothetical protein [Candidatus Syntrophosphaera sp.]